ncbi:MAG: hypothetical protein MI741_14675 [Rhodospirillales bacterium]|nr:hypothetical protein [Rhodospirillales bacterium]
MDTTRSDKMAGEFLAKNQPFKRKVLTTEQRFHAPPNLVFKQFCPTREMDWIDGWKADLIWTKTGYAEADCIFTTPPDNIIGPGLWIFTTLVPNEEFELVRIIDNDVVIHFRIDLTDNEDGTCTGLWTLKFTALNEAGNTFVDSLPDKDPVFDTVIAGLEHFVTTGTLMAHPRA